ncbi:MAG: hypothetical protein NVSMB56_03670 [Pyrinomonadaceae bacterium]
MGDERRCIGVDIMASRIIAGLIMLSVGAFAFYKVLRKPQHPFSNEPVDQAFGIPKVVNRIIRGVVGLLFVVLGAIAILRAFGILH